MLETLKFGEGNWANKTDSTLAYSDQYGNFQAIPFDFTRATTATRVNKQGLIESVNEGIARIDYSDSTQGALLLEPQRTNVIPYSNSFSNSSYVKDSGITVTSNQLVSPSGNLDSDLISVNNNGRIYHNNTLGDYASSVFIKKGSFSNFKILGVNVDLIAKTVSNADAKLEEYSNGWFRFSLYSTNISRAFQVQAYPDNGYLAHTDSGSYYLYGAQIELGSYATSYIPTNGATATRNQEICKNATPEINSAEGVLYAEVNFGQPHTASRYIGLSDGTNNNRVILGVSLNASSISTFVSSGGVTQAQMNFAVNISENHKIALKYKLNDFALWIDGVEVFTDNGGIAPIGLDNLRFSQGGLGNPFFGKTKSLQVFNEALTDAQLQTLTTI